MPVSGVAESSFKGAPSGPLKVWGAVLPAIVVTGAAAVTLNPAAVMIWSASFSPMKSVISATRFQPPPVPRASRISIDPSVPLVSWASPVISTGAKAGDPGWENPSGPPRTVTVIRAAFECGGRVGACAMTVVMTIIVRAFAVPGVVSDRHPSPYIGDCENTSLVYTQKRLSSEG